MSVKLKGMPKLMKDLEKMDKKIKTSLASQATVVMAKEIKDQAKSNVYIAPKPYKVRMKSGTVTVQPGHVRDNIIVKRLTEREIKERKQISTHKVTVLNKEGAKNIAVFLENGTARQSAHPFMSTAFEQKRYNALAKAKKILKDGIERK